MKVVAFMQNMWVKNPARIKALIARTPEAEREQYRSMLIEYCLFAGCVSGRRLRAAFGEDLCDQIIWDEASPEIVGDSKTICLPDPVHIASVLKRHNPDIVITFGKLAGAAVGPLWRGILISAPHPAARQPDNNLKLKRAADDLRAALTPVKL